MNLPEPEYWDELFDLKLNNELNAEQNILFDSWITNNNKFAQQFEYYKTTISLLKVASFKKRTIELEKNNPYITKGNKKANSPLIWIASIAALLCIVGYVVFLTKPIINATELAEINYSQYPNVVSPALRGAATEQTNLSLGVNAYTQQDYTTAIEYLKAHKADKTNDETARLLYLGLSYFETDAFDEAQKTLLLGSKQPPNDYDETILWYLGLSYLKTGEIKAAKKEFNKLIKQDSFYKDRAKAILKAL